MTHWFADNSASIGYTPLIKLNRVAGGEHYLSSVLFKGVFDATGLPA